MYEFIPAVTLWSLHLNDDPPEFGYTASLFVLGLAFVHLPALWVCFVPVSLLLHMPEESLE